MAEICEISDIQNKVLSYKRRTLAATPRVAAVLLLLVPAGSQHNVILTKRMRSLEHHGGEVSFPGGGVENGESLCSAALRETCEEIGICGDSVKLLGALDDEMSRWGHRVTPFVGIGGGTDFRRQQTEVDRIYNVPLAHFVSRQTYWTEKWFRGRESRTVHFFRWENDIVWGLTALILDKFVHLLSQE